jgi:hypothetical protein
MNDKIRQVRDIDYAQVLYDLRNVLYLLRTLYSLDIDKRIPY